MSTAAATSAATIRLLGPADAPAYRAVEPRTIRVADQYHGKVHMILALQ